MSLSGVLIGASPDQMEEVRRTIEALEWAELHHAEPAGRMIATIEGESTAAVVERLKTLKALPGVLHADMVVHCYEDELLDAKAPPAEAALGYLNDDETTVSTSHYSQLKAIGNY